jgi:putative PIN family toxin of toxin-antitoxin system
VNLPPCRLVLDTNVVLDCWVFEDPRVSQLTAAIEAGGVRPLVHEVTLDELRRVLSYPQFSLDETEQQQLLQRYVASASPVPMPEAYDRLTPQLPPGFPRCRDPDDEPFLALALHGRADALITKDRDILKLRRKARKFGVLVLKPEEFQFAP